MLSSLALELADKVWSEVHDGIRVNLIEKGQSVGPESQHQAQNPSTQTHPHQESACIGNSFAAPEIEIDPADPAYQAMMDELSAEYAEMRRAV